MGILRKKFFLKIFRKKNYFVVVPIPVSSYASISKVLFYFLLPSIPGLLLLETDENSPHGAFFVKLSKTVLLSSLELLIPKRIFFSMSENDANIYVSMNV